MFDDCRKPFFDFFAGGAVASLEAGGWLEELAAAGEWSRTHLTGSSSTSGCSAPSVLPGSYFK